MFDELDNNSLQPSLQPDDPFRLSDINFQHRFGWPKQMALELYLDRVINGAGGMEDPKSQMPLHMSLLATLSYLMHGHFECIKSLQCFQHYTNIQILHCVAYECEQIVLFLTPVLIKFPVELNEVLSIKQGFEMQLGVPGVVGVLDCFFVRLQNVRVDERSLFTNRHRNLAINVQIICDHKYRFLNVNARFPGSCSDLYIWRRSHVLHIMRHLQLQHKDTWLVADRGYRLDSILINPYRNPNSFGKKTLNASLKEVFGIMEKALVLLRTRFRCLNTVLPFNHYHCANIITACVTLHNYLLHKGYPVDANISYTIPKRRDLPNSSQEDFSTLGRENREYLNDYVIKNRLRLEISSWNLSD